jgi:hypothetical protein
VAVVDEGRAVERLDPDPGPPFIHRPVPPVGVPRLEAGAVVASRFVGRWRAPLTVLVALMLSATVALAFSSRSARTPDEAREPPAEEHGPTTEAVAPRLASLLPSVSGSAGGDGDLPDSDSQPAEPSFDGLGSGPPGSTASPPTTSATSPNVSSSTSDVEDSTTAGPITTVPASTSSSTGRPSTTNTAPTTTTTTEPSLPPPVDLVTNGGFEQAGPAPGDYGSFAPVGWTSSAGAIELWATGFNGVSSFSGNQHLELNGDGPETISQQLQVLPGQTYQWSFAHQGRDDKDTVRVLIDGVVVDTVTSAPGSWRVVSGTVTIPAGTTQVSFGLRAIDSGSKGNLIDAVTFQRVK